MGIVTAATLTDLLTDTVTVATAEACLKQARHSINLAGLGFDIELADFTGSAGSLTVTYTSAEEAGLIQVAMVVYSQNYKTSGGSNSSSQSDGLGGISESSSSSSSSSTSTGASSAVMAVARDVVASLKKDNFDVSYS